MKNQYYYYLCAEYPHVFNLPVTFITPLISLCSLPAFRDPLRSYSDSSNRLYAESKTTGVTQMRSTLLEEQA